ncbi:maleylpyruvate isomerase family mycothiol-dependent enzyme [Micromonospora andamanensis]|uniref:maleylpyruvate isomerase family mycothiol-dependent enzyme n=1 Tax=Micromonospora andamanensis TaxID=1287068 RepID=UPI00194F9E94|nr:maleylpyruvate isomerase family mycothiol-dependent enzyme [Micromonospora andamanensis]GIJ38319.1 maleylpyruvate isomerase [Micromonospora andamanensis]
MSTSTSIGITERLDEISTAHAGIRAAAEQMTEADARLADHLPGWTRGHILIHLADLSRAFARQARYALKGETIEVYDGGRETRNRSIEANHGRPVEWLREQLDEGLTALEQAWDGLDEDDWQRACAYRNGPLLGTQLAWWRETELHHVDLGTGYRSEQWSKALSAHVVDFLQPRLPKDRTVRVVSQDTDDSWESGDGAEVTVRGDIRTLAAWISGRPSTATPTVEDAVAPELGAWP